MKTFLAAAGVAAVLLAIPAAASATIVLVEGNGSGCSFNLCSGSHPGPGVVLGDIFTPVQLTLGAGSYTVTNASPGNPDISSHYSAWNYSSGWLWSFMAANDATHEVLLDSLPDAGITVTGDQASAAAEAAAVNYVGHFTLSQATTVDFMIEDYYLPDNFGGVALDVELDRPIGQPGGVPEPATWAMMLMGLGGLGASLRASRRRGAALTA
jgi:hypothetical protein